MDEKTIGLLEGLGYVSAIMVAAAGFTQYEALRFFNVAGLVFGLIAVVRLLGLNLRVRIAAGETGEVPLPEPRLGTEMDDQDAK